MVACLLRLQEPMQTEVRTCTKHSHVQHDPAQGSCSAHYRNTSPAARLGLVSQGQSSQAAHLQFCTLSAVLLNGGPSP